MKAVHPLASRLLCAALCLASSAQAQQAGPSPATGQPFDYWGVHAGQNLMDVWPATVSFSTAVKSEGSVKLGQGAHLGVFAGRQTENARWELEYQQGTLRVKGLQLGKVTEATSANGHYRALTVNAYRVQAVSERVSGFVGLGLGWGSVSLPAMGFSGGCQCFPAAKRSGGVLQAHAGLEMRTSEGHRPFIEATWMRLPGPASDGTTAVRYPKREQGAITIGYRRNF